MEGCFQKILDYHNVVHAVAFILDFGEQTKGIPGVGYTAPDRARQK